jgi:hypothetical protein
MAEASDFSAWVRTRKEILLNNNNNKGTLIPVYVYV